MLPQLLGADSSNCPLGSGDEILWRHVDVATDLSEEAWRQVPRPVNWHRRYTTVGMTELLVRPALPHLDEPKPFETRNHLAGSQNGQRPHAAFLSDADCFGPDKLGIERWLAILEEHANDLLEVGTQLFLGFALAVGARKTRHVPNEKASIRVALHNNSELAHTQLYEEACHLPNAIAVELRRRSRERERAGGLVRVPQRGGGRGIARRRS